MCSILKIGSNLLNTQPWSFTTLGGAKPLAGLGAYSKEADSTKKNHLCEGEQIIKTNMTIPQENYSFFLNSL